MRDLTSGSIVSHILTMAAPVIISMLCNIAYQLTDLYFVAKLGIAATAGISAAGTAAFIVPALMQIFGVGTMALVAQAVGRKDRGDANLVFNQSIALCSISGVYVMILIYAFIHPYLKSITADDATVEAGMTFTRWMLAGQAGLLLMTALSSALWGIGVARPTMAFYMLTVLMNAVLAPVFIAGWCTGKPLGVMGAGLATSVSIVLGATMLGLYAHFFQRYLSIQRLLLIPRLDQWRRILHVGLPAGGELVLALLLLPIVYYVLRDFGSSAQAGYGIGTRVVQTFLLPGSAIAAAVGPIVAQNFGAGAIGRVRQTIRSAMLIASATMLITALLANHFAGEIVGQFDAGASANDAAIVYVQVMSWGFVAQGLAFVCSSTFQGFGHTAPSLISSGARFAAFAFPVIWVSTRPTFDVAHVWHITVGSLLVHAIVSLYLVRVELRRRLSGSATPAVDIPHAPSMP